MKKIFENIIIFGDIHGEITEILRYIKKYKLTNTCFISCGDFGVNLATTKYKKTLKYYSNILKSNYIYVTRGNHDDPSYFTNLEIGNFLFIEDYTTIIINNINFLFIGGAISIDRKSNPLFYNSSNTGGYKGRKLNYDYWLDENVKYKPELLLNKDNIDVVITHSAPNFCYPYGKENISDWLHYDLELKHDIDIERSILTNIYHDLNKHKIKYWYYGHFHKSHITKYEETIFTLLNINEFIEFKI